MKISQTKSRYGWKNLKNIELDCNCCFCRETCKLVVCNVLYNAWYVVADTELGFVFHTFFFLSSIGNKEV